jgi:hypothetical protein
MDEVESVANNDQGKLLSEVGLLEEILDFLRVIGIA